MKATARAQKEKVRATYGEVARTRRPDEATSCCAPPGHEPDYSSEEIAAVPEGAFLGAGSGNPVRTAHLQPGEVVVDLGCGAGMDAFLAANRVGRSGRVTGIDMTPDMLHRARHRRSGRLPPRRVSRSRHRAPPVALCFGRRGIEQLRD